METPYYATPKNSEKSTISEKTRIIILSIICFLVFFISLSIEILIYCLIRYKLYLQENDPDIYLTGISELSFNYSSNRIEYLPDEPNLGTTGELIYDCYSGKCKYKGDTGERSSYYYRVCYGGSKSCRLGKQTSKCSHTKNDDYSSEKSCYAYNAIYYWKGKTYRRKNMTNYGKYTYSYLDTVSVISANQSCPKTRKQCGILDNLGQKLCYPNNIECPINYITKDIKNDSKTDYKELNISGTIYYYTNKKNETGRIIGGLYADSDLLIKYKEEECELLETDSISSFLKSNNNTLYKNILDYDPNKDENIKGYLKWCIPGVGKEKNISKIKELNKIYNYNVTTNHEKIRSILEYSETPFYFVLVGDISYFIIITVIFIDFCCKINGYDCESGRCKYYYCISIPAFFLFIFCPIFSFGYYIRSTVYI